MSDTNVMAPGAVLSSRAASVESSPSRRNLLRVVPKRHPSDSAEHGMPDALDATIADLRAECARLEERLRQAEKMEAIGRFASGIAHDFNNVLHGILAYGEMLLEDAPDAKRRRYAQNVLTAAGRGHELAEQILGYIRNLRRKPEPTDVCGTVAETLELLRGSAPAEVTLASSVPDTAIVVMGSDTQLHQVVMNLCTNSLQAMGAKGTVRVAIEPMDLREERALSHGSALPGPWVVVRVEDDGCGMDEATL